MNQTVLVVDDEKNILLTLSQALQLAGYRTELAANGQVALDVLAAKPVDAVLMDLVRRSNEPTVLPQEVALELNLLENLTYQHWSGDDW